MTDHPENTIEQWDPEHTVRVRLWAPAIHQESTRLISLKGRNDVGGYHRIRAVLVSVFEAVQDVTDMIGMPVTIEVSVPRERFERHFHLVVHQISRAYHGFADGSSCNVYEAELVPRIGLLDDNIGYHIFNDCSVPDAIAATLTRNGLVVGSDFDIRLEGHFPRRNMLAQYGESDLAFVRRICEEVGIAMIVEHSSEGELVVFTDATGVWALNDVAVAPFIGDRPGIGVTAFRHVARTTPGRWEVREDRGLRDGEAWSASTGHDGATATLLANDVRTTEEGENLVRVLVERSGCDRSFFEGEVLGIPLVAGTLFTLDNHPEGGADHRYLVVGVDWNLEFPTDFPIGPDAFSTHLTFQAIDARKPFRPPRITPQPRISGLMRGVLLERPDSPDGLRNKAGHYRVRPRWAPEGVAYDHVAVVQAHHALRGALEPGADVLMAFVNGHPCRPVVVDLLRGPGGGYDGGDPEMVMGCGNSRLYMSRDGIEISAPRVTIQGQETVAVRAPEITASANDLHLQAGGRMEFVATEMMRLAAGRLVAVAPKTRVGGADVGRVDLTPEQATRLQDGLTGLGPESPPVMVDALIQTSENEPGGGD